MDQHAWHPYGDQNGPCISLVQPQESWQELGGRQGGRASESEPWAAPWGATTAVYLLLRLSVPHTCQNVLKFQVYQSQRFPNPGVHSKPRNPHPRDRSPLSAHVEMEYFFTVLDMRAPAGRAPQARMDVFLLEHVVQSGPPTSIERERTPREGEKLAGRGRSHFSTMSAPASKLRLTVTPSPRVTK